MNTMEKWIHYFQSGCCFDKVSPPMSKEQINKPPPPQVFQESKIIQEDSITKIMTKDKSVQTDPIIEETDEDLVSVSIADAECAMQEFSDDNGVH